jgi:hypothetical protein
MASTFSGGSARKLTELVPNPYEYINKYVQIYVQNKQKGGSASKIFKEFQEHGVLMSSRESRFSLRIKYKIAKLTMCKTQSKSKGQLQNRVKGNADLGQMQR